MAQEKSKSEEVWLEERAALHDLLSQRSHDISGLRATLSETRDDHTRRMAELRESVEEKYQSEILELRDKVSEYNRRLTSGEHLGPRPPFPFPPAALPPTAGQRPMGAFFGARDDHTASAVLGAPDALPGVLLKPEATPLTYGQNPLSIVLRYYIFN